MPAAAFDIKRFDFAQLKPNATIGIIGKRRTGKSVLLRNIMHHLKHIPIGIAMSPTEEANRFFGDFMPAQCIYTELDLNAMEAMLTRQRRLRDAPPGAPGVPRDHRAFIVADDCMYNPAPWRSRTVREIFMNGRHYNLLFIFTMQYCVDIKPELRANLDYIFVFREALRSQRERLFKSFFGMFDTFRQFNEVFDALTTGFDFMVLDTTADTLRVEDSVFWGRADPDIPAFRVCAPEAWRFAARYALPADEAARRREQGAQRARAALLVGGSAGPARRPPPRQRRTAAAATDAVMRATRHMPAEAPPSRVNKIDGTRAAAAAGPYARARAPRMPFGVV